ncbi:hypothetical protein [Micromonospora sp. NPDC047074]|uniref:hypothetical protein n=1 Tax=Micromonospora sp. NPDC047074 TaxID=3154339 RepID=UPI0033EBDB4F
MIRVFPLLLSAALLATVTPVAGPAVDPPPAAAAGPRPAAATPRVDDLKETTPRQPRWLTMPRSPVVLNPYEVLSASSPLEQSDPAQLPLHAGYYIDHPPASPTAPTSVELNELLMVDQRPAGPAPVPLRSLFYDSFATLSTAWTPSAPAQAQSIAGQLRLQVKGATGTAYAYVSRTVSIDIDQYPMLTIGVQSVAGTWGLKVADSGGVDQVLQPGTTVRGVRSYDLRTLGWRGTKSVTIRIFASGFQKPVEVDHVRVHSTSTVPLAHADGFHGGPGDATLDPGWVVYNATASVDRVAGRTYLIRARADSSGAPHWGAITRRITVDLDQHPMLWLAVPMGGRGWALMVNGGTDVDTVVQPTTTRSGTLGYDLSAVTGWHGVKSFDIKIFVVGYDSRILLDDVKVTGRGPRPWLRAATTASTSWAPHQLTFDGRYADGMHVTGRDVFHDVNSVGRSMTVSGGTTGQPVQISGAFQGTPSWDATRRVLTFDNAGYHYAVALPATVGVPGFYRDREAVLDNGPVNSIGYAATWSRGYWSAPASAPIGTSVQLDLGVGFASRAEGPALAASRALSAATATAVQQDPATRAAEWDALLARVPHPTSFDVQAVPSGGVDAAAVRRAYYRAWVFLAANALPPQPHTGYPYVQYPVGKAAMYPHGPVGARAIASWDSVINMQAMAYLDPASAWNAFTGMLSLVDATGRLGGENLPAREAQTAWNLYAVTGDLARLRSVYPNLRRLLDFKEKNPQWIPQAADHPDKAYDIGFVSSYLVDVTYAKRIAQALGNAADVAYWQGRYDMTYPNLLSWFWATPTSAPVQAYYPNRTTKRVSGVVVTATSALAVPTLSGAHLASLLAYFEQRYDPALPLAGFGRVTAPAASNIDVRHGITSYTIYGLLAHGRAEQARVFSNAILRDAVSTGMFAERYEWTETGGVHAAGQRPSIFGAAAVIDAVWMNNGVRSDRGLPAVVSLGDRSGGVEALGVRGFSLDIAFDPSAGHAVLSGTALTDAAGCDTLPLAPGATVDLPPACIRAPVS